MEDQKIRHISDWLTYSALAYEPADMVSSTEAEISTHTLAPRLTRWLTGEKDQSLYILQRGVRYKLTDANLLSITGGTALNVTQVDDDYLNSFPIAATPLEGTSVVLPSYPAITTALWQGDSLWIAKGNGEIASWKPDNRKPELVQSSGDPVTLATNSDESGDDRVYGASQTGKLSAWNDRHEQVSIPMEPSTDGLESSWFSAITTTPDGDVWLADVSHYDLSHMHYHIGRGLLQRRMDGTQQIYTLDRTENDPLKHITDLTYDAAKHQLWVSTSFDGLLVYDVTSQTWTTYNTLNSKIGDNTINAIQINPDGTLWLAMPAGVSVFKEGQFKTYFVPDDITDQGVLALAPSGGSTWVSGLNYVAHIDNQGKWQVFSTFDNPMFMDRFDKIVLDKQDTVWAIGEKHILHYDQHNWTVYDTQTYQQVETAALAEKFIDPTFPSPDKDYRGWLKAWPRPAQDNGRGIHYLAFPTGDPLELRTQLERLKTLGIRWLLVNYTSRSQLPILAPIFKDAGIMVIWRPFVRPYKIYPYWAKDVAFLRSIGVVPYMQIYNEPSLGQEWEDTGKTVDQQVYLDHLLPAIRQVYDAGGYVGIQHIDLDWLRTTLKTMKDHKDEDIFQRMFFIPHPYGFNHPPDYDADVNSVLGFRAFADLFKQEIGFVPMMVAGEGGWRPDEMQDNRYPMVSQTRHRDYLITVLKWFETGKLSNGEPLPDYLFAFCPWILSDPTDRAAWYDSTTGNRVLVIQAVQSLPNFQRRYSWDVSP